MRTLQRRTALALVPMLAAFMACSENPSEVTTIDEQVNLDVATFAADQTGDDIILMTLGGDQIMGPRAGPPFDASISYSRTVTFYDASDAVQAAYDPELTAKLNIVADLEGSRTRTWDGGTMTVEINRHRDLWVSGLLGQETSRTWDGEGNSDVNRVAQSDERGTRTYEMTSSTLIEGVVVPVPRSADAWPLEGTITKQVTVVVVNGLGDTITRERTVVITFNGTQFVTATVNGEEFEIDLAARRAHRRH